MASAEEVSRAAIQIDGGNAAFLLMAEAMVAIATVTSSTVELGASSSLEVGTMMIIPGLSFPRDDAPDNDDDEELARKLVGS